MPAPSNSADIPIPHSSVAGAATATNQTLSKAARPWNPKGNSLEQPGATLSRFANRLIDRVTGRAFSADELAGSGVRKAVAADVLAMPTSARYVAKTTGADAEALTLADGTFYGQRLNIRLVTDGGGDGTLTPTTKSGFATIVFADAGDFAELEWTASGWIIIGTGGLTAQPTITA